MKTALIFLVVLAVVLGIFAYFAVFGNPTGTYGVNPLPSSTDSTSGVTLILPSSTTSSSLGLGLETSTASSTGGLNSAGSATSTNFYGSAYDTPPLSWSDGGATFSITAAALQNNQLTFTLMIQMGSSPACVPLNLRLVADESGDLQGPITPSFSFPDSGNCNGAPGEVYTNQTVTFAVDPANLPFLFTTGGQANIFFEVSTTTTNGLSILFPSTSG